MLHLGGRQPLRVDIADLFKLQGAFQRNRVVVSAPEIQPVIASAVPLSHRFGVVGVLE